MHRFSYIFYNYFFKYILKLYLKSDSKVSFDHFKLRVFKEVFHPKLFFSTKYFYSFLKEKDLDNKTFLEIGSGSGILSMLAYRKNARVTALDIDQKAVENTQLNFSMNFKTNKHLTIIRSDVFDSLPIQTFDFIAINPPYYFKKIKVSANYAWYCGENGEYFQKLFTGLKSYSNPGSEIYMILQENCEIGRITAIALGHGLKLSEVHQKRINWENNFIFRIFSTH